MVIDVNYSHFNNGYSWGLTKLLSRGLSTTNWELFKGVFPPVTQNQWDEYFAV